MLFCIKTILKLELKEKALSQSLNFGLHIMYLYGLSSKKLDLGRVTGAPGNKPRHVKAFNVKKSTKEKASRIGILRNAPYLDKNIGSKTLFGIFVHAN